MLFSPQFALVIFDLEFLLLCQIEIKRHIFCLNYGTTMFFISARIYFVCIRVLAWYYPKDLFLLVKGLFT